MLFTFLLVYDMYTVNGRVTFSMSRGDGNMSVPSMMYFMQDSINLHVFDIDKGNDFLDAQGKLWAITGWNMKIFRRPKAGERIRCGTYSSGVKGMLATRVFVVESEEGETLAAANSLWIYMDMETRKPTRINAEDIQGFEMGEPLPYLDKPSHRIIMPDVPCKEMGEVPILRHFLDVNGHLNNISYVFLAMEYLPKDFEIKELKCGYKKESYLGDKVKARMFVEDNVYFVEFYDEEGDVRFQAKFSGEAK